MINRTVDGTTYTLSYDVENRLNSVTQGGQTTTFTYDADGQRVMRDTVTDTIAYIGSHYEKQILPQDLDGDCWITVGDIMQVASRWRCRHGDDCYDAVYDLDDDGDTDIVDIMKVAAVWGETCPNPETVKYYTLGGRRVAMRKEPVGEPDTLYYLFSDHLGSSAVVVPAGDLDDRREMRYFPYGSWRSGNLEEEMQTDRLFTGQRFDGTIGLYDYGARWYDPALGRFVQADTIVPNPGNPQDLNRYAYVRNNPLRYTDPSGYMGVGYDPGYGGPGMPLPPPSESWNAISLEDQLLAIRAYLDFLENPGYYRALYLDPTSDPALLAPFQVWAEYKENTSLVLLLEVDLWENSVAQIEGAQQLRDSGVIGEAEYGKMVAGPMLVLGLMEASEGAQAFGQGPIKRVFRSAQDRYLRSGEEGLSVLIGAPDELTLRELQGKIRTVTPELVTDLGLTVVKTPGNIPSLEPYHYEIRPGPGMTRGQFKRLIKQISWE